MHDHEAWREWHRLEAVLYVGLKKWGPLGLGLWLVDYWLRPISEVLEFIGAAAVFVMHQWYMRRWQSRIEGSTE